MLLKVLCHCFTLLTNIIIWMLEDQCPKISMNVWLRFMVTLASAYATMKRWARRFSVVAGAFKIESVRGGSQPLYLKTILRLYLLILYITKTCLFNYTENFTTKKWKKNQIKKWYFSYFCSKPRLWVLVRTASAVLTSTDNLGFWAEIKKYNVYPCKPQFYYTKVGFKGVNII